MSQYKEELLDYLKKSENKNDHSEEDLKIYLLKLLCEEEENERK